jgi:peptide subunit release factor 1 (eRF1)
VFGVKDTLTCLEMGAVETLIVWENLELQRYVFTSPSSGEEGRGSGHLAFRAAACVRLACMAQRVVPGDNESSSPCESPGQHG